MNFSKSKYDVWQCFYLCRRRILLFYHPVNKFDKLHLHLVKLFFCHTKSLFSCADLIIGSGK